MTEPFRQWVIEDNFPAGRRPGKSSASTMVARRRPFEEMKLRLLNGSHSAIAYLGLLSGHATVAAAFADPAIRNFVDALWAEAIPTLAADAGLDPQAYIGELAERFANTALAHQTRRRSPMTAARNCRSASSPPRSSASQPALVRGIWRWWWPPGSPLAARAAQTLPESISPIRSTRL